ncbi:VOC family protein [Leifsonia shinshuensis]|uniref:VOC family protein n=1 Tax=Leifsonia shinshuensis TaxID=150026 RepID=UPI001F507120|nr:VOC family protein [Leifsonia shinshuensis]MCI0155643.1 VOC family protein [Leifsonia shinshuensis]
MQKVRTFLWYDGEAEAAANHYVSLVPDSRIVSVARLGEDGATVLVTFELGGIEYLALDGGPLYRFTEAASIMVLCEDQEEVDRLWDGLVSGGGEPGPCGWCTDRWGLSWQVVPRALLELQQDPDPARAGRANAAMMTMGKLDIAALYAAADASD